MQTGPKIIEELDGQSLGHDVGELMCGGDMKHSELSHSNLFADEVDVDPDVLCAVVVDRVGSHVDCTHIVTVDNCRKRDVDVELLEQLT